MIRRLLLSFATLACLAAPPRTMRVDYGHTGDATSETFGLDRVVVEPLPWPGDPAKAVDASNLGKYFFEVDDKATGRILYSRGFASIFGEWETTDEARGLRRTFEESLRFPEPSGPVRIHLKERDTANAFKDVWTFDVDPRDIAVERALPPSPGPVLALQKSGDPADKVDFLILGDGYTAAERPKFEKDARRLMDMLFAQAPFKEHRADFNVWGICPPAQESGISRPSTGVHRHSPLGATYDAFGSERYILTFDNKAWREAASFAPYEFVEILVNGQTYGGGGIFNLFSTVAADNAYSPYVFVHEFGHHFAGLADEYYTSDVAVTNSPARPEPWEPNVTANPKHPKWVALLNPATPLPTPWKKAEFEAFSHAIQKERRAIRAANKPETEMEALFAREKAFETKLLGTDAHSGQVGAFEGANYEASGYYRSQEDCIMFTRDSVPFCAACRSAIERVIRMYAR
ncbi:MAG TPA: M64 family metallopeptidase [Holophagaceae bacterium]